LRTIEIWRSLRKWLEQEQAPFLVTQVSDERRHVFLVVYHAGKRKAHMIKLTACADSIADSAATADRVNRPYDAEAGMVQYEVWLDDEMRKAGLQTGEQEASPSLKRKLEKSEAGDDSGSECGDTFVTKECSYQEFGPALAAELSPYWTQQSGRERKGAQPKSTPLTPNESLLLLSLTNSRSKALI
jgi:hypothetical protein